MLVASQLLFSGRRMRLRTMADHQRCALRRCRPLEGSRRSYVGMVRGEPNMLAQVTVAKYLRPQPLRAPANRSRAPAAALRVGGRKRLRTCAVCHAASQPASLDEIVAVLDKKLAAQRKDLKEHTMSPLDSRLDESLASFCAEMRQEMVDMAGSGSSRVVPASAEAALRRRR